MMEHKIFMIRSVQIGKYNPETQIKPWESKYRKIKCQFCSFKLRLIMERPLAGFCHCFPLKKTHSGMHLCTKEMSNSKKKTFWMWKPQFWKLSLTSNKISLFADEKYLIYELIILLSIFKCINRDMKP